VKLRYPQAVRNITVSVPDEVYRQAKIRAAERGRSISELVTEFLADLGSADDELVRLLAHQDEILAEIGDFRAGDRLPREELYDRGVR
jgi:plasmid stability protein